VMPHRERREGDKVAAAWTRMGEGQGGPSTFRALPEGISRLS
jgi:hypothetical protein